jgi:quercetin dioxygenase-like cupin family protein
LLKGRVRYQLGDEIFEVKAPYTIHIPSMVPHAFMNLNPRRSAEIIAFFPDNIWEFDIIDHPEVETFFDPNLRYELVR